MIAVILIFYRQKDKHRTIMERKQTKRIIIFLLLLLGIILPNMAQKQKIWKAFCDKCRREKTIVGALPSQLEKALRWSPGISNEQKEVIRYILWNMVYVEGGTANLGENNDYPVNVGSFFINRYEVSQDEWYVIMGENPSNQHRRNYPVDQVNWYDTQRFTRKLSQLSGLPFRLPFEAEWEYAARGGLNTQNYIYAGSDDPTQVAWCKEKYSNENTYVSNDIGTKKPNELGLYDMSGNIYEWCMDWYDKKVPFTGNIDPDLKGIDLHKVLRGGSYYTIAKYCKITNRYGVNPLRWDIDYGLRLVISFQDNTEEKRVAQ